jgi:hypothetical protein
MDTPTGSMEYYGMLCRMLADTNFGWYLTVFSSLFIGNFQSSFETDLLQTEQLYCIYLQNTPCTGTNKYGRAWSTRKKSDTNTSILATSHPPAPWSPRMKVNCNDERATTLAISWTEGSIYVPREEFRSQHQSSSHPFPVNFSG